MPQRITNGVLYNVPAITRNVARVANFAYRNRRTIMRGAGRIAKHISNRFKHRRKNRGEKVTRGGINAITAAAPGNERAPKIIKYKKKLRLKGRKRVKVSRKLRAKITQVVEGNKVHGYFQDNRVDLLDPGLLPGQQNVERLPNRTLNFGGYLFNYDRVLHAASRLWNNKGPVQSPQITDLNNFNPLDTVIEVNKQWWVFRMRNNSMRTATIRIYKCQSRNAVQLSDALFQWTQGLAQMVTDGQLVSASTSVNTMHTGPHLAN